MSTSPPGTLVTNLPARFRIKTPTGKYLTNKLWSSTAGTPTLSLNQAAPVINFSIIAAGLYSLPANYVALKDADVSASNSGHYHNSSSYVSRGTFWSSAQGGGPGWAWQFYKQSDGTFIIINNKDGVNNYLFEPSFTTDWPQVTTNLASATKFTVEDSTTSVSTTPSGTPSPVAMAPTPQTTSTPTSTPAPKTSPAPAPKTPPAPAPSPATDDNTIWIIGSLSGSLSLCVCIIIAVMMMSTKKRV